MTAVDARQLIKEHWEYAKNDRSTLFLIGSNLITLMFAALEGWSIYSLLWIYWAQSLIIGFFNFLRMWKCRKRTNYLQEFFFIPLKALIFIRKFAATWFSLFFIFHYGGLHLGFLEFLLEDTALGVSLPYFLFMVGIFFVNHWFSYKENLEQDSQRELSLKRMMFFPYLRIIPMHITVAIAVFLHPGTALLILFIVLKTLVDVEMHIIEHKV